MNKNTAATINPTTNEMATLASMSDKALKRFAKEAIANHLDEMFALVNWEMRRRRAAR